MWRIRLFRVLLPLVIVGFVVYLVYALSPRPRPLGNPREPNPQVTDGTFKQFGRDGTLSFIDFEQVEEQGPGRRLLRGVREARIPREGGSPLLVRAARGEILGEAGADLRMIFESGVVLEDPDVGLTLRIPSLTVDEAEGTARSPEEREVVLSGRALGGTAARVIYGLDGRPTELRHVDLTDDEGANLRATTAYLRDGLNDIELVGEVRLLRGGAELEAGWMRVAGEGGRAREAEARSGVRGHLRDGAEVRFRSDRLSVAWDEDGRPTRVRWNGGVEVRAAPHTLRAQELEALPTPGGHALAARGGVEIEGPFGADGDPTPGLLTGETLEARLDAQGALVEAQMVGGVAYEGGGTRADGSRGRYDAAADAVVLTGTTGRKARLARGDYRVAGVEIRTGADASTLEVRGAVEATLLETRGPGATGMFRADRAIHFVADALHSAEADGRLVFEGRVRAWQESRNLAAQRIEILQQRRLLRARDDVHTRLPRTDSEAFAESDFIQISSSRLDYDEAAGVAVYEGEVRVMLAEGRIDADRLEVEMRAAGGDRRIGEVRASGGVEVEFRSAPDRAGGDAATSRIRGTADRLVYDPDERVVRLLGDATPAVVTREDGAEGSTRGRVVLYRLETGAVEVEAGGRRPARIQGGTNGAPDAPPTGTPDRTSGEKRNGNGNGPAGKNDGRPGGVSSAR